MEFGYSLSSEEHPARDLVRFARRAEEAGFAFAQISDHFHPWIDEQGQSPFVWAVLGGIAQVTERIEIQTGVTCPIMRIHPAVVAHAAATIATMMPGRFALGLGTGENLNEHILGDHWPPVEIRQDMLSEAVTAIRLLWEGGQQSYRGEYYTVENARLYSLPSQPPSIRIAASGPKSAQLAGRIGDGLISTSPDVEIVSEFVRAGGKGKPRFGQVTVCWAESEAEARRTAHRFWPTSCVPGELSYELALPGYFEDTVRLVTEDQVAEDIVCGPDPEPVIAQIQKFEDAGFDHVSFHQIGPDQEGFFRFWQREVMQAIRG